MTGTQTRAGRSPRRQKAIGKTAGKALIPATDVENFCKCGSDEGKWGRDADL